MAARERRKLTVQEQAAAMEFRRLLLLADYRQEDLADALGVTQGAVHQWANGHIPISAKRAPAIAALLKCEPADISAEYASLIPREVNATQPAEKVRTASQFENLDPLVLSRALFWLDFEERNAGLFQPVRRAQRLIDLYAMVAKGGGELTPEDADQITFQARQKQGEHDGRNATNKGRNHSR
jgi:transcriptional regulator with XRE-family HTH domain